jgi:hypothetical protein
VKVSVSLKARGAPHRGFHREHQERLVPRNTIEEFDPGSA